MLASLLLAASLLGQSGSYQPPGPPILVYWAGPVDPLTLPSWHPGPAGVRNLRMGGASRGRGDVGVGPAFLVVHLAADTPAGWYGTANAAPWYLYLPPLSQVVTR